MSEKWIKCSEFLPLDRQKVLITDMCYQVEMAQFRKAYTNGTDIYDKYDRFVCSMGIDVYTTEDIEAWMPLPNAYVGEETER